MSARARSLVLCLLERMVWFSGLLDACLVPSRWRWSGSRIAPLDAGLVCSTLVWPHLVAGAGLCLAARARLLATGALGRGDVQPRARGQVASRPNSQPNYPPRLESRIKTIWVRFFCVCVCVSCGPVFK